MSIFSRFSKKKNSTTNDTPIIKENESVFLGGNGLNIDSPVFINCASSRMAEVLIDRFISEKHGQKGTNWEMGISFTLSSDKTDCGMVKSINVKTSQGEYNYYFDLSRPMATLKKIL